jgi:predicted PhzF superfamily epimerase YddE/YHI9
MFKSDCGCNTDCNTGNAGAIIGAYIGQNLILSYVRRFIQGEKVIKEKALIFL